MLKYLSLTLPLFLTQIISPNTVSATEKWLVYYNDKAPPEAYAPYSLIVLDSDHHSPLDSIKALKKTVLGYISLGEVENNRSFYPEVKNEGILLEENLSWPGSFFVDLRDPRWSKRVIEEIIPSILEQRFDGLFLDTLDNPGHLERENPEKYKGMVAAAVLLVKLIREHYPTIPIMMNRGYELLPEVADSINMELGESIYSDYDPETKTYKKVDPKLYQEQVKILKNGLLKNKRLKIYTLDYWDPKDNLEISKIYEIERGQGFIPYVSNVELDQIVPEPI